MVHPTKHLTGWRTWALTLGLLPVAPWAASPGYAQDAKPEPAKPGETKKAETKPEDLELAEKQKKLKELLEQVENNRNQPQMNPRLNPMPLIPQQPIDPRNLDAVEQQMQKQMREMMLNIPRGGNGMQLVLPEDFLNPNGLGFPAKPPRLGIRIMVPDEIIIEQLKLPNDTGLIITEVLPGTLAEKIGLKPNDIILEVGGKKVIQDPASLPKIIEEVKANTATDIVVLRKGEKKTLSVTFPEAKAEDAGDNPFRRRLGMQLPLMPMDGSGNFSSTSVSIINNAITIQSRNNERMLSITGKRDGDSYKLEEVTVKKGDKTNKYTKWEDMPEADRQDAEKIWKSTIR